MIQSISAGSITFTNGEVGTVTVGPDGRSVQIDPGAGGGTATFTYTVRDSDGGVSAPATVTVKGPLLNTAPVARNQSIAVTTGISAAVGLDASDADGDPLVVVDLTDPSAIVQGGSGLTITVLAPAAGTFTITYRVTDGTAFSDVATVTVVASDPPPPPTTPPPPPPPTTTPSTPEPERPRCCTPVVVRR